MAEPRGPFMNEDGDWWVAVDEATQDEALRLVAACAYGPVEFVAIEDDVRMSDHEIGDGDCPGGDACTLPQPCARNGRAYHFREQEVMS